MYKTKSSSKMPGGHFGSAVLFDPFMAFNISSNKTGNCTHASYKSGHILKPPSITHLSHLLLSFISHHILPEKSTDAL